MDACRAFGAFCVLATRGEAHARHPQRGAGTLPVPHRPVPPVENVRPDANRLLETYQEFELRQAEDARAAEARARAAEERATAMAAELEALRARPPRSSR